MTKSKTKLYFRNVSDMVCDFDETNCNVFGSNKIRNKNRERKHFVCRLIYYDVKQIATLTRDQKIIERNKEISHSLAIYKIWQIEQKSPRVI
jgi:hypothetical protein